jgi:Tol biopolymer transport system component
MEEFKDLEEKEVVAIPKKTTDEVKVNFKMKKIYLIIGGIIVLLAILTLIGWKMNAYGKAYSWYYKSNVNITVTEKGATTPVAANIEFAGKDKYTPTQSGVLDANGKIQLTGLVKGSYKVTLSLLGYYDLTQDVVITKGSSDLSFELLKVPPKQAKISGIVANYVNEINVDDAKITVGDKTTQSRTDGKFYLEGMNLEEYTIKVEKAGFITYSSKITIADVEQDLGKINLTPDGKVVFSSNRDKGKSGIFTANYDGSDQKALVERVGEHEDLNPLVSPDNKKVAFISDREGKKDENNNDIKNLYVVNLDGSNLVKAGDLNSNYGYQWIKNSTKIMWSAYSKNISSYYIYDVASKTNSIIGSADKSISGTTINNTEDKIVYSVYNSATYRSDYFWVALTSTTTPTQILADQSNISIIKFDGDVITYSQYSQEEKATKYHTLDVATGVVKDIKYEYPKGDSFVKSPDGKTKAFISNRDGKSNVFISDLTGAKETKLTSVDSAQWPLSWSLDSKMILFNVNKTGESAMYIVGVDGGTAKKVVDVYSAGYGYGMY